MGSFGYTEPETHLFAAFLNEGSFSWSQLRNVQVKDVSDFEKAFLNFNNDKLHSDGTYRSNDITYIKKDFKTNNYRPLYILEYKSKV